MYLVSTLGIASDFKSLYVGQPLVLSNSETIKSITTLHFSVAHYTGQASLQLLSGLAGTSSRCVKFDFWFGLPSAAFAEGISMPTIGDVAWRRVWRS